MINWNAIENIASITGLSFEESASIYSFLATNAKNEEDIELSIAIMQDCIANDRELSIEDVENFGQGPVELLVELDRHSR